MKMVSSLIHSQLYQKICSELRKKRSIFLHYQNLALSRIHSMHAVGYAWTVSITSLKMKTYLIEMGSLQHYTYTCIHTFRAIARSANKLPHHMENDKPNFAKLLFKIVTFIRHIQRSNKLQTPRLYLDTHIVIS